MLKFLVVFILLYGAMNALSWYRIRTDLPLSGRLSRLLGGWAALMVFAPILVRLAEEKGAAVLAQAIAWPGFVWMGFIFILCSLLLCAEAVHAALDLALIWRKKGSMPAALHACSTRILLVAALLISCYASYEARSYRIEQITIPTRKLSPGEKGIRVVQISDVHIGLLFREHRLEPLLALIRSVRPDILVSTGDLVDGRLSQEKVYSRLDRTAEMLAALPARLGKFAVPGNHEHYAGIDRAVSFTERAGFTVLRGRSVTLPGGITVRGIDDQEVTRTPHKASPAAKPDVMVPDRNLTILLKHRPVVTPGNDGIADLQVSGHVHKGQIFPFNYLVQLEYRIPCGTTHLGDGRHVHVSRGTGTWGPPMRFLAPPEVTVIDLVPASP